MVESSLYPVIPDWAIFEFLGKKFYYKSSLNVWWLFGQLRSPSHLKSNWQRYIWGNFFLNWSTFYFSVWSHCLYPLNIAFKHFFEGLRFRASNPARSREVRLFHLWPLLHAHKLCHRVKNSGILFIHGSWFWLVEISHLISIRDSDWLSWAVWLCQMVE